MPRLISKKKRLRTILRYASATYVLNPDLLRYSPTSRQLTYASVDVDHWPIHLPTTPVDREVVIFHAPSDRLVKGSDFVEQAVDQLKTKGYRVRLDLVTGVPHDVVLEHIQAADIVVDQLLVGWYGGFAVETMAMGKPTVSYLNPEWLSWTPMAEDCPIIQATQTSITETLQHLLDHPETWTRIGKASRAFCEKYHDPKKIAARLIRDYQAA